MLYNIYAFTALTAVRSKAASQSELSPACVPVPIKLCEDVPSARKADSQKFQWPYDFLEDKCGRTLQSRDYWCARGPFLLLKAFKSVQLTKARLMHSKAHGMHRAPVIYAHELLKESGVCSIEAVEASMPHFGVLVPALQDQSV